MRDWIGMGGHREKREGEDDVRVVVDGSGRGKGGKNGGQRLVMDEERERG